MYFCEERDGTFIEKKARDTFQFQISDCPQNKRREEKK